MAKPSPQFEKSLFGRHSLQPGKFMPSVREHYPSDWIILSFLACSILFAWVHFYYFKRIRQIYRSPISQRFLNILTKDGNLFRERISISLIFIYLFTYSLVISLGLKEFIPNKLASVDDYRIFAIISASLFVFWVIKISAVRVLGNVFRTGQATQDYLHNILVFEFITGLFLFPVSVLIVFIHSSILLNITLAFMGLIYLFRMLRGFFIGLSVKKFSYLLLFVYLCSLEILPLLIILKGLILFSKGF
jgi:hypothetical protein